MDHIGFTTIGELTGKPGAYGAGLAAHVNGDPNMPQETRDALAQMIVLAYRHAGGEAQ